MSTHYAGLLRAFTLCVLGSVLVSEAHAAAATTLTPVADAFVTTGPSGNLSTSNYGSAGALAISAPGSSQGEFQSVMQFDLASAKSLFDAQFGAGQWRIQSISLQLSNAAPNNPIFNATSAGQFSISWMQNDSWTEGTGTPGSPGITGITFSSLSNFVSAADETLGTFSYNGATTGNANYALSLPSGFTADVAIGNLLSLRFFAADSAISYLFDSRNFGQASGRPMLSIVVVPEPASSCLAALWAAMTLWRTARERKCRG